MIELEKFISITTRFKKLVIVVGSNYTNSLLPNVIKLDLDIHSPSRNKRRVV